MAIKTQLKLFQMTGSYGTAAGLINDQGSAIATGSAAAADLGAVLSQMASAIKRINGSDSFSQASAGVFTHAVSTFSGDIRLNGNDIQASDGVASISMSGRDVSVAGDLTVTGNDIKGSGGTVMTMDGSNNAAFAADVEILGGDATIKAANDGNATLNLQADNADDNGDSWLMSAQTDQSLAVANNISGSPVAMLSVTPHATAAQSLVNIAGKLKLSGLEIQNADGEACISIDADQNATIAADLNVSGGKVSLTNGATIDSETAGKLKLTEDLVECSADLTVLGNDLDFAAGNAQVGASVGANVLSLGGATSTVAALNDLRVDGDILADANENKAIFAAVTSANITLGAGSSTVIVPGNLTVQGTTTTVDTTNLLVKDPLIAMGVGNQTANSNGGIAIMSGSNNGKDLVFGRIANDTLAVGILDTQSGSITSVAAMDVTNFRASRLEIDSASDYLDVDTDLKVVAAADILLDPAGNDVKVDGNMLPNANNTTALGSAAAQWSDAFLGSGAVVNFDNGDMTLTHGANLLTVAGGQLRMDGVQKVEFGGANDYIHLDTDLKAVAAADVVIRAGGDSIRFKGSGTNQMIRLERGSATAQYMNFTADDSSAGPTGGSGGFGFRNNAGTMQFKNNGGSWTNFGSSTNEVAAKVSKELTAALAADNRVFGAGNGLDCSSFSGPEDNGRIDLFVNGQLMLSGGAVGSITKDYALDVASGRADMDVQLNFALYPDDVVTLSVK